MTRSRVVRARRTARAVERLLGDVRAVQTGRVGQRIANRVIGRLLGRLTSRLWA
jgi:DNA-binding TFAR19-related protein (PDSD5 family)